MQLSPVEKDYVMQLSPVQKVYSYFVDNRKLALVTSTEREKLPAKL